jgi:uncharacterized membrane protein YbaN (DUF454 family)
MTHLVQNCSEIALTFDRVVCRPTASDLQSLCIRLRTVDGVLNVETRTARGVDQIVVVFADGLDAPLMLRRMAVVLRSQSSRRTASPAAAPPTREGVKIQVVDAKVNSANRTDATSPSSVFGNAMGRVRQFVYGTLAVGSFVMAWVGLLLPGIPTVPFVILTAYFAAKASPSLRRRLTESRVFGPMIKDWERYRAVRPSVRRNGIILTVVLVAITLLVAPPSAGLYTFVATMFVFSIYVISRIPVLKEESDADECQVSEPGSGAVPAVA